MLPLRGLRTISEIVYILLVLTVICAIGLSCVAVLSQAVRTSPNKSWRKNYDVLVIGAAYVIVLVASLLLCAKRRIAVRLRLQRISESYQSIERSDFPKAVRTYISQEYVRACLISYHSQPHDAVHEGWGKPGTKYADVHFRQALLDTIPEIEALVHAVIPSHPASRPHERMIHHFRHILPLFPTDEDGLSVLHYHDSAIQLARISSKEPTEEEFEFGMQAAEEIKKILIECRLEMMEDSPVAQLQNTLPADP